MMKNDPLEAFEKANVQMFSVSRGRNGQEGFAALPALWEILPAKRGGEAREGSDWDRYHSRSCSDQSCRFERV